MADGRLDLTPEAAHRLVAEQFPQWADLEVAPVARPGWDNLTFRLGPDLVLRIPSAEGYAGQAAKEATWLPRLAPHLPVPVPEPVAIGRPGPGVPFDWSVRRWIPGLPAFDAAIPDPSRFATDVAGFLRALHRIDAGDGPPAGPQNFHRGGDLAVYEAEALAALDRLAPRLGRRKAARARAIWRAARRSRWQGPPIWVHGDIAGGNLLVRDGRLAAVIDFGTLGTGDPAADLVLGWTFLDRPARGVWRAAFDVDDATWARAAGWALWKATIVLVDRPDDTEMGRALAALLDD